jgi:hypothetical protein
MRRVIAGSLALWAAACSPVAAPPKPEAPKAETTAPEPVVAPAPLAPLPLTPSTVSAEGTLTTLYKAYREAASSPPPALAPLLTADLAKAWAAKTPAPAPDAAPTPAGPATVLGFDPVLGAQAGALSDFTLQTALIDSANPGVRMITVAFEHDGVETALDYTMRLEDGAWRIDNIRKPGKKGFDLRKLLTAPAP